MSVNGYSTLQALEVWDDLVRAYHQRHPYGTDTAEIYAYRLLPHTPSLAIRPDDLAAGVSASAALSDLLTLFTDRYTCEAIVDGEWFDRTQGLPAQTHRWHVRIVVRS